MVLVTFSNLSNHQWPSHLNYKKLQFSMTPQSGVDVNKSKLFVAIVRFSGIFLVRVAIPCDALGMSLGPIKLCFDQGPLAATRRQRQPLAAAWACRQNRPHTSGPVTSARLSHIFGSFSGAQQRHQWFHSSSFRDFSSFSLRGPPRISSMAP